MQEVDNKATNPGSNTEGSLPQYHLFPLNVHYKHTLMDDTLPHIYA